MEDPLSCGEEFEIVGDEGTNDNDVMEL